MSDTHVLLSRIAALRQRLEQAKELTEDVGSTAAPSENDEGGAQSGERSALCAVRSPSFRQLDG